MSGSLSRYPRLSWVNARRVAAVAFVIGGGALLYRRVVGAERALESTRAELGRVVAEHEIRVRDKRVSLDEVRALSGHDAARSSPAPTHTKGAVVEKVEQEPSDPGDLSSDQDRTADEQALRRVARFDHIQGIFKTQEARDFDPTRARRLEVAVEPALDTLRASGKDATIGSLDCRGRMCVVDVSFESPDAAAPLVPAVFRALRGWGKERPHVHLVIRDVEQSGRSTGRLFFEWLKPET